MNKLSIQRFIHYQNFPFYIFAFGMLIIHLLAPIPIGDDTFFISKPAFNWSFLEGRYFNWTSRLVIEFFVVAFLNLPLIVWRIINTGIIVLLGIAISQLFVERDKCRGNWLIISLLLVYPFREMLSAGWVTISINYFWPLTFGLLSLVTLKKIILQKKIRWLEYILGVFVLLFAVNQEIMAVSLLLIYVSAAIYLKLKKRSHWFVVLCIILCAGSLIFIFTTPGNAIRRDIEIRWFIDFDNISFIEKLEIGITSTLSQLIFNFNFLFFIFCLLLFIGVFTKYKDPFYKVLGLFPLVMSVIFGNGFYVIVDRLFPHLALIDSELSKYGLITLGNFTSIQSYIPFLLLFMSAWVIAILVYLEFGNSEKSLIALGVLGLGVISRLVLSFSPTIFASGSRTFFLLFISIIICSVMVFQSLSLGKSRQFMDNLLIAIGFIGGFSYLDLLLSF